MVRLRWLRGFISELAESPLIEKISFILPFFVIIVDVIVMEHAIRIQEHYIIALTTILFLLSLIEIIVVTGEIHDHYKKSNFERTLTIKLDDFIIKERKRSAKRTVEEFIKKNPCYEKHRNEVYHIACQIMETHAEEKKKR
jgi:hypothetical protein